jgi:hypothetical protein
MCLYRPATLSFLGKLPEVASTSALLTAIHITQLIIIIIIIITTTTTQA